MKKENAGLEQSLEALVQRLRKEVMPAELETGQMLRLVTQRQIGFGRRKSLLKWQREELAQWLDENLDQLLSMGLLDKSLQDEMAELRAFEMGIELDRSSDLSPAQQMDRVFGVDPDAEMMPEMPDLSDDMPEHAPVREATDDSSASIGGAFEELLRSMQDAFEEAESMAPDVDASRHRKHSTTTDADRIFKRLFRQTAAALHPDREVEESRRLEKHALMSQLLKARKEHDLIAIVGLHEQYATADSALSSDDQTALEAVLEDYLEQQHQRREQIILQSPTHHLAYEQFHAETPAAVTRKIRKHLKSVREQREIMHSFLLEVTTLKVFKQVLEERYDARLENDFLF